MVLHGKILNRLDDVRRGKNEQCFGDVSEDVSEAQRADIVFRQWHLLLSLRGGKATERDHFEALPLY